jgi:Fe-S-cluster containining protein
MQLPVLKQPWYADGLRFTCTASGDCCTGGNGFVWLADVEIDRIAAHLNLSRKTFLKRHCRTVDGKTSLNERCNAKGQWDCTFLTNPPADATAAPCARGCSIYPVRPTQCRTWPFWPENLTSRKAWNQAAKGCRGMNHGTPYPRERIESLRDATDWPDNPPSSAQPAIRHSPLRKR